MNCWEILDLSPDTDLKAIKQRYAARVKKTKPNEDPEGFQQLHSAYKEAIQWAKSRPVNNLSHSLSSAEQASSVPIEALESIRAPLNYESKTDEPEHHKPLEYEPQNYNPTYVEPGFSDKLTGYCCYSWWEQWGEACLGQQASLSDVHVSFGRQPFGRKAFSRLKQTLATTSVVNLDAEPRSTIETFNITQLRQQWYQNADAILNDLENLNKIECWETLLNQDIFFDITLRPEFSDYIFGQVAQRLENPTALKIKQPTLRYLNEKLLWTEQRASLEYGFSDEDIQLVYDLLGSRYARLKRKYLCTEIHQGEWVMAGMDKRLLAGLIDVLAACALAFCLLGIGVLLDPKQSISFSSWIITSWLMLFIITVYMEASPIQGSLGKMLMGIKVLSHEGKRLSGWKSFVRQAVFWISARYIMFTIFINAFYLKSKQFAHDRGAQSLVVLR